METFVIKIFSASPNDAMAMMGFAAVQENLTSNSLVVIQKVSLGHEWRHHIPQSFVMALPTV